MDLLKISLVLAVIGTALLLFLSIQLEPKLIKINEIDMKDYDSFVKIQGVVFDERQPGNITILTIRDDTSEINAVVYEKIGIIKGDFVEIIGKVSEYDYNLQIDANKIKKL